MTDLPVVKDVRPALFLDEVRVIVENDVVHLVGMTTADGNRESERFPISHVVMSNEAFRRMLVDGRTRLAKGGH
ncbi:hypothetical protein [Mesorhizobium sp. Cs1321R2N1]|uniref:hypothetical protein n=1 Tax=Mesorhizobium sp. Cs1321R2N1 TaxID=3015174 RepID=UPI00301BB429